jgi:hypothetical protein
MNNMVDYGKVFKTPFADARKLFAGTFILLGFFVLMMLISFVFMFGLIRFPIFASLTMYIASILIYAIPFAYFVRYGINCARKKFVVPSWEDLEGMFKDGVKLMIIMYIYYIPVSIIYFLVMGINPFIVNMTPEAQMVFMTNFLEKLPLFLGIVIPLYLLLYYLMPIVCLRFMDKRKFVYGFDFKTILKKAFSWKYLGNWLLSILIMICAMILLVPIMFLLAITIIGIPIIFVIVFPMFTYVMVMVLMSIYGQAYGETK